MPPPLAWINGVEDGKPGPVHVGFGPKQQMRRIMTIRKDVPGEYLFFEVKLTKIRYSCNLGVANLTLLLFLNVENFIEAT